MHASKSSRTLLSEKDAVAIFVMKYADSGYSSQTAKSRNVSAAYGISAKTVRDIWCGRSWLGATHDLWQTVLISFQITLKRTENLVCFHESFTFLLAM